METQKLVKSATVTRTPFWQRNGPPILGVIAALSLLANVILYAWGDMADESSDHFFKRFVSEEKQKDEAVLKYENLRRDLGELTGDEADALRVTGPEAGRAVMECLEHPQDLSITPWALKPSWEIKLHNPAPIMNAHGTWFGPGDACGIDRGSTLRVTRWQDVYVLQPWTPPGVQTEWWACPDEAFHFVGRKNGALWPAVFRACLAQVKAKEYGLSR